MNTTTATATRTEIATDLMDPTAGDVPETPENILRAIGALHDRIHERAPEIESARRLPGDLVGALAAAGAFRILVPTSYGGAGADVRTALAAHETLARADASVGWTTMIGSIGWLDLVGLAPATLGEVYRDGPDVPIAGVFNPSGTAEAVADGLRVGGRWAFASGCTHAPWLYVNCLEQTGGDPRFVTALLRPDEVQIEDTWHVLGLRGSGSHHLRVDDLVVPSERTFATFESEPAVRAPIVGVPMPSMVALGVAAVAAGTARGALDEMGAIAGSRTPLLAGSALADDPLHQHDLAAADTGLRGARARLFEVADEVWDTAVAGDPLDLRQRAFVRATAVAVVRTAVDTVRTAITAGGGAAIYLDNPLQRRLRDIHTIAQHFIVRPDTLVHAGAVLAGREPDVAVF